MNPTCQRKRRYATRAEAEDVRYAMMLRLGAWATRRLSSFKCTCGWYHLGNGSHEREMIENLLSEKGR